MPELPEVETVCQGIAPYLQNAYIKNIVVRNANLRWKVSPELITLTNIKVLGVHRRAKYLIISLEKGYIVIHLGMSGILKVVDENTPLTKHDHIDMRLDNKYILRYNDPRRFGAWLWTPSLNDFHLFKNLGPEPLSHDFHPEYLFKITRNKSQAIKAFIMNNSAVVGVGNIYANESLFLANINPTLPAKQVTFTQLQTLVYVIKEVLVKAIKSGGTSLKDFVQPDGKPGYFVQDLYVYGRQGKPCLKCDTLIKAEIIGQRKTFYCPCCQKIQTYCLLNN